MSPGARGDFLADRPAPGRRDVGPPKPQYAYPPPPYYSAVPPAQANTWLGAPLISMANPRRSGKPFNMREDIKRRDETYADRQAQLSKIALHAQGAPLIIQNRYHNGGNNNQRKYVHCPDMKGFRKPDGGARQFIAYDRCDKPDNNFSRNSNTPSHGGRAANMDTVSVTSDESSGSNNSEAALPRIIKPRKRRKKDRKPNNLTGTHEIVSRKHDVSDDVLEPRSPGHNTLYPLSLFEDSTNSTNYRDYNGHTTTELKPYSDALLKNYQFSGLAITNDYSAYVRACEAESVASVCQCRYCDPSGQIWDIDSFSFSELFDESSTVDFAPTKLEDSMKVVGSNSKKSSEIKERDTTLRRSWSDPSSTQSTLHRRVELESSVPNDSSTSSSPDLLYSLFSSPPLTSRAEGFFGRSARLSSESDASSYRLVPELKLDMRLDCPPVNLEVSSEIVTSLNGHRDLEIKFFSTSPPASAIKSVSFFDDNSVNSDKNKCLSDNSKESSELIDKVVHDSKVTKDSTCETESEVT